MKSHIIIFLCFVLVLPFFPGCGREDLSNLSDTLYVRRNGADMPAYIYGNAASKVFLIVLHGAGSFGLAFREGIFKYDLESQYAVVYWDQRSQSMAQGKEPGNAFDVAERAEDVRALIQTIRHKYGDDISLFMMGHSWGGALGSQYMVTKDYQYELKGWIEVDGAHDFPQTSIARKNLIDTVAQQQIDQGFRVNTWQGILDKSALLMPGDSGFYDGIFDLALESLALVKEDGLVNSPNISADLLYHTFMDNNPVTWRMQDFHNKPAIDALDAGFSVSDELVKIRIPCLFLWGKYDFSVPPEVGKDGYGRVSSAFKDLIVFERSEHHPFLSEPELFLEAVEDFIELHK